MSWMPSPCISSCLDNIGLTGLALCGDRYGELGSRENFILILLLCIHMSPDTKCSWLISGFGGEVYTFIYTLSFSSVMMELICSWYQENTRPDPPFSVQRNVCSLNDELDESLKEVVLRNGLKVGVLSEPSWTFQYDLSRYSSCRWGREALSSSEIIFLPTEAWVSWW